MALAPHQVRLRVRYSETDQMGVVHHAAWVPWFELARIEWLRAQGRSYRALEESGILMPVTELAVKYRRSAKFDDEIDLFTTAAAAGPSRLIFTTLARRDETLLAEATVTVAAVDRSGRPCRLPAGLGGSSPQSASFPVAGS
jgi:acyl-CoA thioester hydrolase